MSTDQLRERYFEALGLQLGSENALKQLTAALARAHDIRKFEIELYWKRATYFWAFQVAAFTAFGLFWGGAPGNRRLAVAFAGIGFLIALAAWIAARGSKFWQENWEKHIDMLEDSVEGRLHKTVWMGPRGVQFSVSRVNEKLNFILMAFWVGMLAMTAAVVLEIPIAKLPVPLTAGLAAIALFAAAGWLWRTRTQFLGNIYDERSADWQPYCSKTTERFRILRRHAPGEGPNS